MKKSSQKCIRLSFVMLSAACLSSPIYAEISPNIVGGSDARIQDVPWQVALLSGDGDQFCGGSIISERWILTAAHCLDGTFIKIRAGVTDRNDPNGQDIDVKRQIAHADYNKLTLNNDIALLELKSRLNLSGKNAKAIPIMTTALESTGLQHPGKSALISGWGSTSEKGQSSDILQKAIVTIFDNSDPNLSYKEGVLTNAMIVAGYLDGFIDGCQGDSGGPMVVRDLTSSVGYRLAGVTSFGEGCARARYPGVYAKVSNFEDWISDTINKSLPTMEVGNAVVREGDAITRKADFLVSLSYKSLNTVSVAYQTVNGSATAGSDYEETHGTLTFGPGQVAKVISIPIISDTTKEDYENFFVKLTSPAGAILFDSKGTGEIIDGD